jgi:hypothetical protein
MVTNVVMRADASGGGSAGSSSFGWNVTRKVERN